MLRVFHLDVAIVDLMLHMLQWDPPTVVAYCSCWALRMWNGGAGGPHMRVGSEAEAGGSHVRAGSMSRATRTHETKEVQETERFVTQAGAGVQTRTYVRMSRC
jgi:hypothetical protein